MRSRCVKVAFLQSGGPWRPCGERRPLPYVILTEVSMPVMDGITMITRLRERGVTVPVLAVGGDAFLESLARLVGADAFLLQPVGQEVLLDQVAALVATGGAAPARTSPGVA